MRIKFNPIKPATRQYVIGQLNEFNIPYLLFQHNIDFDEIPTIDYIQSYSDNCRYDFHIIKGWLPHVTKDLKVKKGHFCFMEIKTWFELPFNFVLFRDTFANYWDRDYDVHVIKPEIIVAGNEERHLAIATFRSLASSFFRKIYDRIGDENSLIIIKKNQSFVLAFKLNKNTEKAIDYVIENFANAVYETIKATECYGYYELPDIDYKIKVSIADQYKLANKRKFLRRNKNRTIDR